jgi:hypothetical protein
MRNERENAFTREKSRSGDRAFLNGTRPCLEKWITTSASIALDQRQGASLDGRSFPVCSRSRSARGIWAVRRVLLEQDGGGWRGPTA